MYILLPEGAFFQFNNPVGQQESGSFRMRWIAYFCYSSFFPFTGLNQIRRKKIGVYLLTFTI